MDSVFNHIPSSFFNPLSSMSDSRMYAGSLLAIWAQFDTRISYRLPRREVRDSLAMYLAGEGYRYENTREEEEIHNYNDLANAVLRRMCLPEVGWLEEDVDGQTFEKILILSENGLALAEMLQKLIRPEQEEYAGYIYQIYNILNNPEQWKDSVYVNCLKPVSKAARALSRSLKKLSTYIRSVIEDMVEEETLESLTNNIRSYCSGDFLKEYSRLVRQENVHMYRNLIQHKLDAIQEDEEQMESILCSIQEEEKLSREQAMNRADELFLNTRRFLSSEYQAILSDIQNKINVYLELAVARARFLQSRSATARSSVEQVMVRLMEETDAAGLREEIDESLRPLFLLDSSEFIDPDSIRYPNLNRRIDTVNVSEIEALSEETLEASRQQQLEEARNPFSREKMKHYLDTLMQDSGTLESSRMPLESRDDLLAALSAAAYALDNGFEITLKDGYTESHHLLLRNFEITRKGSV